MPAEPEGAGRGDGGSGSDGIEGSEDGSLGSVSEQMLSACLLGFNVHRDHTLSTRGRWRWEGGRRSRSYG